KSANPVSHSTERSDLLNTISASQTPISLDPQQGMLSLSSNKIEPEKDDLTYRTRAGRSGYSGPQSREMASYYDRASAATKSHLVEEHMAAYTTMHATADE